MKQINSNDLVLGTIVNNKYVLGVDIGGTKIRVGLVDINGDVKWSITKTNHNFDLITDWVEYFVTAVLNEIPNEYKNYTFYKKF